MGASVDSVLLPTLMGGEHGLAVTQTHQNSGRREQIKREEQAQREWAEERTELRSVYINVK